MKRGRYMNFNSNTRLKAVAKLYARMLLSGSIDYNILYITSYNSDRQKCILTVPSKAQLLHRIKLVLNNRRLQEMLAKELTKLMEDEGFDVAKAIKYRTEILEGAIDKKQFAIANQTLDSLDNKLGIGTEQLNKNSQPLLSKGGINFDHLTQVKAVNYTEIKEQREEKQVIS